MIRVAFPFVGDSIGGSHISTLTLIESLDFNKYKPVVLLHELGPLADLLKSRQIEFVHLPLPSYAGSKPKVSAILNAVVQSGAIIRRFCVKYKISLVHGNDLRINLTWGLSLIGRRTKFIWHQRSIPKSRSLIWKAVPYLVSQVVCISETVGQFFSSGTTRRSSIVLNPIASKGCDSERKVLYRNNLRRELGLPAETCVLCFVGRLVPWKKADIFIRIVSQLNRLPDGRPVIGVLIGADQVGLKNDLESLAADLGVGNRLFFLGFRTDIERYIGGSDVLVAPSFPEPFGRTLVEAMLLKIPVVASNGAGHKEILVSNCTGYLANVDDIEEFTYAITKFLSDDHYREAITSSALHDALGRFSVARHVKEIEKIYSGLIHG